MPGELPPCILPGGPLDRLALGVEAGDVIVAIDGQPIPAKGGLDRALDGMAGRSLAIDVLRTGRNAEERFRVTPMRLPRERMLHQYWVDGRSRIVRERSGGCNVYQHLSAMDNDNYLETYGRIVSAVGTAQAALIDVRSNLGGNLHRQLLNLLSGTAYAQVGRDGVKDWVFAAGAHSLMEGRWVRCFTGLLQSEN